MILPVFEKTDYLLIIRLGYHIPSKVWCEGENGGIWNVKLTIEKLASKLVADSLLETSKQSAGITAAFLLNHSFIS